MNYIDQVDFTVGPEGSMPKIARWKIFTPEEAELARQADESYDGKLRYVQFYRENDPEYYEKGLKFADAEIRRYKGGLPSKEEYDKLLTDMIYSLHRFGCSFEEYFMFDYQNLNVEGRSQFITDKVRYYLYNKLNLQSNRELFRNKAETYKVFGQYYKRRQIRVDGQEDYEAFADFANAMGRFIVKPMFGRGGINTTILDIRDFASLAEAFAAVLAMAPVVLEELIDQAPEMAKLHPGSVNTVRVCAVKSKDNREVYMFHSHIRTGLRGGCCG